MIYLGADHRGYMIKEKIKSWLSLQGILFEDLGAAALDADDDYPDYAEAVAIAVAKKPEENRGIVICGSGAGVCITANKFHGIRAALALTPEMAKSIRNDDDVNILCLAADFTSKDDAMKIVDIWLHAPFAGEDRYKMRIAKIADIESRLWRTE